MRVLVACVAMLLMAVPVSAEAMTIHFTAETGPAASGSANCLDQKGWLLADEAAEGKAYMSATSNGLGCATAFTYTVSEAFTTAGPFEVALEYDCDTPTVLGSSPATSGTRFTLQHNGETIQVVTNGVFAVCTGSPISDGAVLGAAGLEVAAGDTLGLTILWWGSDYTGPTRSLHVVAGSSSITVPVEESAGFQTLYENLTVPAVSHAFSNATSDTHVLNFTTDLVNSTANFSWNATSGSVNATLADANGTTVFEGTFEGNGTLAHDLVAVPGDWNLTLQYNDFNGSFAFELAPRAVPVPEAPVQEGNATQELGSLEDQESPGPAVLPALVLLAFVCWRRRT